MEFGARFPASTCARGGAGRDMASTEGRSRARSHHEMEGLLVNNNNVDPVALSAGNNNARRMMPLLPGPLGICEPFPWDQTHQHPSSPLRTDLQGELDSSSGFRQPDLGGVPEEVEASGGSNEITNLTWGNVGATDSPFPDDDCKSSRGRGRSTSVHVDDWDTGAESLQSADIAGMTPETGNEVQCDLGFGEFGDPAQGSDDISMGRARGGSGSAGEGDEDSGDETRVDLDGR